VRDSRTVGIVGWGFVAAGTGALLPEDLDPLYQPLLGRRLRKVGRFIKLAVAGAVRAVERSGIGSFPASRTGVVLGTGLGNVPELVSFTEQVLGGAGAPSPTQFANTVGNSAAFYVAQAYGLSGPALAVSQDEVSFEGALLSAVALFCAGDLDFALVGGVDVYWPEERSQRLRMGYAVGEEGPPCLGEGSGWLVLERGSERPAATLEEVSLLRPAASDDTEDLARRLTRHPGRAAVCLGARLAPRARELEACLPAGASLVRTVQGAFLSESAVHLCALLDGAAAGCDVLHTVSETREGLRGTVTVRRAPGGAEPG
jgi:hypothetical protein